LAVKETPQGSPENLKQAWLMPVTTAASPLDP